MGVGERMKGKITLSNVNAILNTLLLSKDIFNFAQTLKCDKEDLYFYLFMRQYTIHVLYFV